MLYGQHEVLRVEIYRASGRRYPRGLTQDEAHGELLRRHDDVILAYPVYFSDLPQIVREFICKNSANFRGKNVFIIATMEIFSGDGAGCAARILGRAGAKITGGTHVKMPAFILDVAIFSYLAQKNERLINDATEPRYVALQRVRRVREVLSDAKYKNRARQGEIWQALHALLQMREQVQAKGDNDPWQGGKSGKISRGEI